jgi:hypothetical protein
MTAEVIQLFCRGICAGAASNRRPCRDKNLEKAWKKFARSLEPEAVGFD